MGMPLNSSRAGLDKKREASFDAGWTDSVPLMLAIAFVYFVTARMSLFLAFQDTNATPVWPPTGIALACVLLFGYRIAPSLLVGAFFANLLALGGIGVSIPGAVAASLITACGNTLEAMIGAALIRRFTGTSYPFENVRDSVIFIAFGVVLATMISATIGVTTHCFRTGDWSLYARLWITWWLGDATGAIVVAPALLTYGKISIRKWSRDRVLETVFHLLFLCVVAALVFVYSPELRYLILPVLLWAVLRFGLFETCGSILLVSAFAVYGALYGSGGLSGKAFNESLLFLQSYIGIIAATVLLLSVAVIGQRRTEEALRSEKSFTDTIIDSVPGAFYVLDLEGRLVRWNRFLEDINNLSGGLLSGMDSLDNIHEEDRGFLAGKIAEAIEKGHSEGEARIEGKRGTRDFFFTGRRFDVEGAGYVVGSGIDITERKSAERKLLDYQLNLEEMAAKRTAELTRVNEALAEVIEERSAIERTFTESEKKYRDLIESANSAILRFTQEGTITFINKFAEQFFGFAPEEILGSNIVGTIVPETDSSGHALSSLAVDIASHPERFVLNENENIRKNGERVWVSWTNKPITDDTGRIVEILSVGNDITDRKIAEDRLRRTLEELATAKEKAEVADRLKSAFLASMSHELRTPLNSIIGFTGIVLQGYAGPLTEEQSKQLNMVRKSANHLLSLINDVLDISKIEAGQLQLSPELFDLGAVIEQALLSSRPAADKKGLSLSFSVAPEVDPIMSDRRRVEQILLNLVSNAIKFTEEGGVKVECRRKGEFVEVSVTDTGIGIREEDMGKLFAAFQQIDFGTTRRYEGTGLGLHICKRLVELLGGKIYVTSVWESGTTFSFTLPHEGSAP